MLTDLNGAEAVSGGVCNEPQSELHGRAYQPNLTERPASACIGRTLLQLKCKAAIGTSAFKSDSGVNALAYRKRLGRFSFAGRLTNVSPTITILGIVSYTTQGAHK
jgi:hypothetical protein